MSNEITLSGGSGQLDMAPVETAVALLRKACDKAVDGLGGAVPGVQLGALLVVDDAGGSLELHRLAAQMTASVSATSRVCDWMPEAGLLTVADAASSRPGSCCMLTGSGRRLARWVRARQRAALSDVVNSMRPQARDALVYGLGELAAAAPRLT
jgi:hypothetical protein